MRQIPIIMSLLCILTSCSVKSGSDKDSDDTTSMTTDSVTDRIAEVTVMELRPSVFDHEVVSNGRLTARETVDVNFETPGLISAVYVSNGSHVAKGQKIAALDTYRLKNQMARDRNAVASAQLEMQDVIIGHGYDPARMGDVPQDVVRLARLRSGLEQAELALAATQHDIDHATLVAPISGTVANLSAKPHNMSSSTPLCRIINEGGMDVEFTVLESELPMVRPGDRVTVTPFAAGEPRHGRVREINPMVDDNGMVKVWATVDGGKGLIDGMNVRVNVKRAVAEALVIPKSAVVLRSGRQVVFTLDGDKAMWNYVTTGLENLDQYTVTDGLAPGMTVITSGNINLAHETPVKVLK